MDGKIEGEDYIVKDECLNFYKMDKITFCRIFDANYELNNEWKHLKDVDIHNMNLNIIKGNSEHYNHTLYFVY